VNVKLFGGERSKRKTERLSREFTNSAWRVHARSVRALVPWNSTWNSSSVCPGESKTPVRHEISRRKMPTTMTMGTSYHFVPDTLLKEEEFWINTGSNIGVWRTVQSIQGIALRVGLSLRESLLDLLYSYFSGRVKRNWKFNIMRSANKLQIDSAVN